MSGLLPAGWGGNESSMAPRALPATMAREEAETFFRRSSFAGSVGRLFSGRLRRLARIHVPFHLYEVVVRSARGESRELVALEAVRGSLDLLLLEAEQESELVPLDDGRNQLPVRLSAEAGVDRVREKLRRVLYARGFFRLRGLSIEPRPLQRVVFVPYWVGFYGDGQQLSIRAVDAVRRSVEGAKVRHLILEWLQE